MATQAARTCVAGWRMVSAAQAPTEGLLSRAPPSSAAAHARGWHSTGTRRRAHGSHPARWEPHTQIHLKLCCALPLPGACRLHPLAAALCSGQPGPPPTCHVRPHPAGRLSARRPGLRGRHGAAGLGRRRRCRRAGQARGVCWAGMQGWEKGEDSADRGRQRWKKGEDSVGGECRQADEPPQLVAPATAQSTCHLTPCPMPTKLPSCTPPPRPPARCRPPRHGALPACLLCSCHRPGAAGGS